MGFSIRARCYITETRRDWLYDSLGHRSGTTVFYGKGVQSVRQFVPRIYVTIQRAPPARKPTPLPPRSGPSPSAEVNRDRKEDLRPSLVSNGRLGKKGFNNRPTDIDSGGARAPEGGSNEQMFGFRFVD